MRLRCFEKPPFLFPVIQMDIKEQIIHSTIAAGRTEIERAIRNAKRTALDKWWRRRFYKETGRMGKQLWRKGAWRRRRSGSIPFHIENKSRGDGAWRNRYTRH